MKKIEGYLYEEETEKIRRACAAVWREFGGSFKEAVVDRALTIALQKEGLGVEDQKRIDIFYEGQKVGTYVIDKVVNRVIAIEIKCKPFLHEEDKRQFWRYLKGSDYRVGYLINFSPRKTEVFRRVYDQARNQTPAS